MKKKKGKKSTYKFIDASDYDLSSRAIANDYISISPPCFNDDELSQLIELADKHSRPSDILGGAVSSDALRRRSHSYWLAEEGNEWVYDKVWKVAAHANKKTQYKIDSLELAQIAYYDERVKGFLIGTVMSRLR
ncbi:hypothetical protein [Oceanicoccus sp. KOV_DT_Chl]|uniref:hypothetical protein n=1 Tax=Oceanicoccus sp. KOV_DT_Chl TaxID=1904639 RepID=UPI000C7C2746|nr:hypothetical protein [Oceanicoccus sp. KOV_DT_Chl]